MSNKIYLILLVTYLGVISGLKASEPTAETVLSQAAQEASATRRSILLTIGHSRCGWCLRFDAYYKRPAVRRILEKYFVVAKIDSIKMEDGKLVFSRFAQPGTPAWVILSPELHAVADSFRNQKNVGYPSMPDEVQYYLDGLRKAQPNLTDTELATLASQLDINSRKR